MKIKNIMHELLYDKDRLQIDFDKGDRETLMNKLVALGTVDPKADYDVIIKKHRVKRSNNANAYMWVLADKIGEKTCQTKEHVYREAIRRVGVFADFKAQDSKAGKMLADSWNEKGLGWFAETFDTQGCRYVRLYYGSSTYNTKEMSRLIDEIVEEAKGLDIETATPDEIARLKAEWEAA